MADYASQDTGAKSAVESELQDFLMMEKQRMQVTQQVKHNSSPVREPIPLAHLIILLTLPCLSDPPVQRHLLGEVRGQAQSKVRQQNRDMPHELRGPVHRCQPPDNAALCPGPAEISRRWWWHVRSECLCIARKSGN